MLPGAIARAGGGRRPYRWDGVRVSGAEHAAARAAADAAANGSKNAAFMSNLQAAIGENFKRKLLRNGVTVWEATVGGSLPIVGGAFVLPSSASLVNIVAADIDTGTWIHRIESSSNSAKYLATRVTPVGGGGPATLSGDLEDGGSVTLGEFVLYAPSLDTASGALFQTVALSDMRKPGWTGTYATSYAENDATLWGRGGSSQSIKASLTMSRYPMKTTANTGPNGQQLIDAFVAARNPDYALELQDGVVGGWIGPQTQTGTVARLLFWNQILLDATLQFNHAPGYTGNSRVMMWGTEVWVKLSGTWTRLSPSPANAFTGEVWSPRFNQFGGAAVSSTGVISTEANVAVYANNIDARIESATGYMSARPAPYVSLAGQKTTPQDAPYWQWHGFSGGLNTINPANVQDILVLHKTALVLHTQAPSGTDDRDYARFLLACGADYYPASGVTVDGNPNFVPGVGTSRHKYVRAKYPNWQWHVMHTMTEAELAAANGYPASLANLVEGA